MTVSLVINGVTYDYPETGDLQWGPDATDWASAVTTGMLQKAGGTFQLLAEVDFGTAYGIKSLYYKSRTANVASAGQIRLARADVISFRNQANSSNLDLGVNSSDQITFNGTAIGTILSVTDTSTIDLTLTGTALSADVISLPNSLVTNAMLANMANVTFKGNISGGSAAPSDLTAAQVTANLNVFGPDSGAGGVKGLAPATVAGDANKFLKGDGTWSIPAGGGDVVGPASSTDSGFAKFDGTTGKLLKSSAARIAFTDLAALTDTYILVGNGSNNAVAVAVTGDVTISNTGVTTIANSAITNAKISASAAIDFSKLAALTSGNILVGSAGNVATSVAMSGDVTIIASGATTIANSAITNAKVSASAAIDFSKLAALTSGNILVGNGSNVATSVAMSSEATISNAGAVTLTNSAVIGKVLTGYTSGAGTVAATDTILQAIQKLNGNDQFVGCYYNTNTASTFAASGYMTYEDQVYDTNTFSSDGLTFTVPTGFGGKYLMIACAGLAAAVAAVGNYIVLYVEKNGSTANMPVFGGRMRYQTTTSISNYCGGPVILSLSAGDTIKVFIDENVTNSLALTGNAYENSFFMAKM